MGFFSRLFLSLSRGKLRRENETLVAMVRGMDAFEVALLLVDVMIIKRIDPLISATADDPIGFGAADPMLAYKVSKKVVELRRSGLVAAAGVMSVWLVTYRAADPALRYQAKQMWAELARGFPLFEDAISYWARAAGHWPDCDSVPWFPRGLRPNA
ncbi:hypothetical protein ACJ4V0_13290 [Phreatobacter sp. HK31-P]